MLNVQKAFWIQTLIKQLFKIFMKLPEILHFHKNHNFLCIGPNWKLIEQLLLLNKFYGRGMLNYLVTVLCFFVYISHFFSPFTPLYEKGIASGK